MSVLYCWSRVAGGRTALTPEFEASTSTMKGLSGLGKVKMGADVNKVLSCWNTLSGTSRT